VLDGTIHVGTEEAYDMSRRLAAEEGILVGKSAGAVMVGAMRLAGELDSGVVVCVFADGGSRYLSSALFEE